jgi:hypothetical protein
MSMPAPKTGRLCSPPALANIAKIIDFMTGRDHTTIPQLMNVTGLSEESVSDYLRHLAGQSRVHCKQRAVTYKGGSHAAKWAIGPRPHDMPLESECAMPRKVTVRQSWEDAVPAMFEPMAYFFGRMQFKETQ